MAPQTKADISTVTKMLDITRTAFTGRTGIDITPAEHKRANGRPIKNQGSNKDVRLAYFTGPDGEPTTETFIADPWPLDFSTLEANEKERRSVQGQGPRITVMKPVKNEDGTLSFLFGPAMSRTQKHWKRSDRRARNRVAAAARRRNRKVRS